MDPGELRDLEEPTDRLRPSTHPHIGELCLNQTMGMLTAYATDHGLNPILKRVRDTFPMDYPRLLEKRIRVLKLVRLNINRFQALSVNSIWHPMKNVVEDWPLAVADGSNVTLDDFLETDHVRRKYKGASLNLMYRPDYRWYYLKHQSKDEAVLIKNFDSSKAVKAACMSGNPPVACSNKADTAQSHPMSRFRILKQSPERSGKVLKSERLSSLPNETVHTTKAGAASRLLDQLSCIHWRITNAHESCMLRLCTCRVPNASSR